MKYFELYEAERRKFRIGARFKYIGHELEIIQISGDNNITLKYLNGWLKGFVETCLKSFVKNMCEPLSYE